jgi:tetratricopeptide (TPR) repeat protein
VSIVTDERPLTVQEAYEALDAFGRRVGRVPLLLLMHAAVPQSFRADLLNLLKVNFLSAEAGTDMTVDADVLLSSLVQPAAAGYYQLDPEVRRHCLALLDAAYRDRKQRRTVEVAWFLLAYADAVERQAALALDALLSEYLAIQRWVAFAFIDPSRAAATFARTIAGTVEGNRSVALRLGSVTAAMSIPLAGHEGLLAYARGIDALTHGDTDRARRLLEWTKDEELEVGGVRLRSGREVLTRFGRGGAGAAAQSQQAPRPRIHVNVPPASVAMVGREQELVRARRLLLEPGAPSRAQGPLVVDIVGLDGVGKWTFANAIVHEPDIVESFEDGIIWLGEDGHGYPRQAIEEYGKAIGVDLLDDERLVRRDRFRETLADRRVLFVADHRVTSDIEPTLFREAGPRCAALRLARYPLREDKGPDIELRPLTLEECGDMLRQLGVADIHPDMLRYAASFSLGLPLILRLMASQPGRPVAIQGGKSGDVRDLLEHLWRDLSSNARAVLEHINDLPYRTWFTTAELDDGLSPPVEQMLAGAPVDILGGYARIHPLVRQALPDVIAGARTQASSRREAEPTPPEIPVLAHGERAFVSYARADRAAAEMIMTALERMGFQVFRENESSVPEEGWPEKIRREVANTQLFVPLISRAALESEFVRLRLDALGSTLRNLATAVAIVPVVVDDVDLAASSLPPVLRDLAWVSAPGGEPSIAFMDAVRDVLRPLEASTAKASDEHEGFVAAIGRGDANRATGKLQEALNDYFAAREIAGRLIESDASPGRSTAWRDLWIAVQRVSEIHGLKGDLDAGLESSEEALEIARRIATIDAGDARDLLVSLIHAAGIHRRRGDPEGALIQLQEAHGIAARMASEDPGSAVAQHDLWASLNSLGEVLNDLRDLTGARRAHEEALDVALRLATADSANASAQHDLWVSSSNVGGARRAARDLSGALRAFEDARAIAERFAKADTTNAEWQQPLAVSWMNIGAVREDQRELIGALHAFEQGRAIFERLVAARPEDVAFQQALADTWNRVSSVRRAQGDVAGAERASREARAIADRLVPPAIPRVPAGADPRRGDYAIVVAVTDYPELGVTIDDAAESATAIEGWLASARGGGIPPDRIRRFVTPRTSDRPSTEPLRGPLDALMQQFAEAGTRVAGTGPIARRLYVYFRGLATSQFARGTEGVQVLLMDASRRSTLPVDIGRWMQRFAAGGFFDEIVLWVDGREIAIDVIPGIVGANDQGSTPRSKLFTAVCVQSERESAGSSRPRSTNALTNVLLEGLRGAAIDTSSGRVTSESLAGFISNRMPGGHPASPGITIAGTIVFADAVNVAL